MTHKSAIYFEYTDGREVNGCTIQVNLFRGIIVLFDQQASTAANHLHFVLVGAATKLRLPSLQVLQWQKGNRSHSGGAKKINEGDEEGW